MIHIAIQTITRLVDTARELASDGSLDLLRHPGVEVVSGVLRRPAERASARAGSRRVGAEDEEEADGLELLLLELGRLGRCGLAGGMESLGVGLCEFLVLVLAVLKDEVAVRGAGGRRAVDGLAEERHIERRDISNVRVVPDVLALADNATLTTADGGLDAERKLDRADVREARLEEGTSGLTPAKIESATNIVLKYERNTYTVGG